MRNAVQIAPTEVESKGLAAWLDQPGNTLTALAEAEQYLAVIGRIPTFRAKAAALSFRWQCADIVQEALVSLQIIDAACDQVRASNLSKIMIFLQDCIVTT